MRTSNLSHLIDRCKITTSDPPGIAPRRWFNFIPASSVDARSNPGLGHRTGWMLLLLEGYCRSRCYCWASNAELAAAYGCSENSVQDILRTMEAAGILRRVSTVGGRPGRVGIILMRRLNPDLPTAEEDEVPAVVAAMKARVASSREEGRGRAVLPLSGSPCTRESGPSAPGNPGAPCTRESGYGIKTLSLKEDEREDDAGEESVERQRPEGPPTQVPPAPVATPPDPVAAAPIAPPVANVPVLVAALAATFGQAPAPAPPACPLPHAEVTPPPLTPGQVQFLASLNAGQAATLESLPAAERARLLEPHRPGFDRIIAREQARGLAPKPPAAPLPALPGTTAELWEHLPGAPPGWVVHAENDLVRDFNDPKFRPAYHQLAEAVWNGTIAPWKVVDAHRQAMNPGSRNRGAVFNHALKAHRVLWEGSRPEV